MQTITIICPQIHIADANQFARCIGLGPTDEHTFVAAMWQDSTGSLYSVASGFLANDFINIATSILAEPAWGCDMAAALRAQALLRIHTTEVLASNQHILAVFGDDAHQIISAASLTHINDVIE